MAGFLLLKAPWACGGRLACPNAALAARPHRMNIECDRATLFTALAKTRSGLYIRKWAGRVFEADGCKRLMIEDAGDPKRTMKGLGRAPASMAKPPREPKDGGGNGSGSGTAVITRTKTRTKKPNLYRVLLLNDDYTPMEFVIHVLERFFNKTKEEATQIMLHVHHNGVGECGVFTYEVAETKVTNVMDFARKHQHPLQCVMEKN